MGFNVTRRALGIASQNVHGRMCHFLYGWNCFHRQGGDLKGAEQVLMEPEEWARASLYALSLISLQCKLFISKR
jgi:hypothetical protein